MSNWKPDKNRNCKKCTNWYEEIETGEFGTILSRAEYCHLLHHIRLNTSLNDDICDKNRNLNYLSLISNLFESLENERDEGCMFFDEDTQEFEFDEKVYNDINCFIANICPLYKED